MLALEQMVRQTAEVHKTQDVKIQTDLIFLSEQTVNLFHNQFNQLGLFVHLDQNYASGFNLKLVVVHYMKYSDGVGKVNFWTSGKKIVLK